MKYKSKTIAQSIEHVTPIWSPLLPHHMYAEKIGLLAMLTAKRSAGVKPEVNLREHITCTPLSSANMAAHSGFEIQRRHQQKSKTGVSVPPTKGLMSSKH